MAPLGSPATVSACSQPSLWSVASAFDLAANGQLPPSYPQFPQSSRVRAIPPSLLKAVGWVESRWRQFTPAGRPLVSFDFGYGIMQITSGMAGAFGQVTGDIDPDLQSQIASDYRYNIAYGARMLIGKWTDTPRIGDGDPAEIENWYYALWAYNGWGWVNNPNNPRFTRAGTPLTDPAGFPYQERVLYLVAHPPRDGARNPLWSPVPVTLPDRSQIAKHPGPFVPAQTHRQDPPTLSAVYRAPVLHPLRPSQSESLSVGVVNTGTEPWVDAGTLQVSLSYHLLTLRSDPWKPLSPFSAGVLAFGQGSVPLPRPVLPGQSATLQVSVQAPAIPGTYRIAWDLQQETVGWFSQFGSLPRVQTLRVADPLPTPQAHPTPSPTPHPAVDMTYVADTSVPDGTVLSPHASFIKGWLLFNSGHTAWGARFLLKLVSGRSFGSRTIPVPPTQACRSANVTAPMVAPGRPGAYRGVWQMLDGRGHRVGDPLTVVVQVKGAPSGTPVPAPHATPTPVPTPSPRGPTPTPTPVG